MSKEAPTIVTCTVCGKTTTGAKAMQQHLKHKHQITGRQAHMIANPNDKQAARKLGTARRTTFARSANVIDDDDDFQVIE